MHSLYDQKFCEHYPFMYLFQFQEWLLIKKKDCAILFGCIENKIIRFIGAPLWDSVA